MSERFFDDLARTLAQPMPRRRAVRVLGAAVLTAAVSGLRPALALGAGAQTPCDAPGLCPSDTKVCGEPWIAGCLKDCCLPRTQICCTWKGTPPTVICCGKDERCGDKPAECLPACPPGSTKCGRDCCEPYENCVGGKCECNERCGGKCCEEGATCRNDKRSLCCPSTWKVCTAGSAGAVKCCPPREKCCFESGTKKVQCCGPEQECDPATGACRCKKKGQVSCGSECCNAETETCASGRSSQGKPFKKCCPKGKVLCAGACCEPKRCVRNFEGGGKVCCPRERLMNLGSMSMCCPPGKRSTGAFCR